MRAKVNERREEKENREDVGELEGVGGLVVVLGTLQANVLLLLGC